MTTTTTRPRVQPGDVIVFSGTPHVVDTIEERTAFDCPIARSADGWGISLDPDGTPNIPSPNKRWQHIPPASSVSGGTRGARASSPWRSLERSTEEGARVSDEDQDDRSSRQPTSTKREAQRQARLRRAEEEIERVQHSSARINRAATSSLLGVGLAAVLGLVVSILVNLATGDESPRPEPDVVSDGVELLSTRGDAEPEFVRIGDEVFPVEAEEGWLPRNAAGVIAAGLGAVGLLGAAALSRPPRADFAARRRKDRSADDPVVEVA